MEINELTKVIIKTSWGF